MTSGMLSSCWGNFQVRNVCSVGGPQVLRCVSAPGSPGFGAAKQTLRGGRHTIEFCSSAKQTDVRCGEGVHFTDGAQSDIFRGPFADSGDVAKQGDGLFNGAEGAKQIWIVRSGVG